MIWVYKVQIDTTLGNGGETVGTSKTLAYFSEDCNGKGVQLAMGKKESADDLFEYLTREFDVPYTGYTDEVRATVNEHFGTKGWKKV